MTRVPDNNHIGFWLIGCSSCHVFGTSLMRSGGCKNVIFVQMVTTTKSNW